MTQKRTRATTHLESHSEATRLRTENERLREELAKLIADRDYLTTTELPAIEAEYNLKIGCLEYEAFILECDVRRARRRHELAQSYINRSAPVPFEIVERELDSEFSRWQAKIEAMRREIEAARQFDRAPVLSAEDSRELQTLYRSLAKRLHPDLKPHQPERERNLWLQVATAYRDGALDELRTLALLVADNGATAEEADDPQAASVLDTLHRKGAELRAHIERLLAQLAELKTTQPYTLTERLSNPAWLDARKIELHARIAELQEQKHTLETHFRATFPNAPHAPDEEWAEIIEVDE